MGKHIRMTYRHPSGAAKTADEPLAALETELAKLKKELASLKKQVEKLSAASGS